MDTVHDLWSKALPRKYPMLRLSKLDLDKIPSPIDNLWREWNEGLECIFLCEPQIWTFITINSTLSMTDVAIMIVTSDANKYTHCMDPWRTSFLKVWPRCSKFENSSKLAHDGLNNTTSPAYMYANPCYVSVKCKKLSPFHTWEDSSLLPCKRRDFRGPQQHVVSYLEH